MTNVFAVKNLPTNERRGEPYNLRLQIARFSARILRFYGAATQPGMSGLGDSAVSVVSSGKL